MSFHVRIQVVPRTGRYCWRFRKAHGIGPYRCVLPINRLVSFRKSEQHPWLPAVRVCHRCAMELAGERTNYAYIDAELGA